MNLSTFNLPAGCTQRDTEPPESTEYETVRRCISCRVRLMDGETDLCSQCEEIETKETNKPMKITEIVVNAGRTFNHPYEQYSNLKPGVTLKATIDDGEDVAAAVRELQQKAEGWIEDHKQGLLRSIEELQRLTERQAEVRGLEESLRRAQERLDAIRSLHPELKALPEQSQDRPFEPQ